MPGVAEVVNEQWFGGQYKDDKPENYFAQFGTDPQELFKVYPEFKIPPTNLKPGSKIVRAPLWTGPGQKYGWKVGDRINITGQNLSRSIWS